MKLQLKRSLRLSNGAAQAPSAEQMSYGEIAVNYSDTDPSIFLKDSSNVIRKLAISSLPDTSSSSAQSGTLDDRYLMLSGGTVSGDVSATNFLGGVARVATSAPASGAESELWFNSATGRLYIRYSGQWVDASPDSFTMGTDFYSKTQTDSAISTAVTALENGQVATNTTAIAGLTSDIAAEESARLAAEADKMDVAGGTFTGPVSFNEDVIVKGGAGGSGEITLNCENNSHGVKLKGPAHSAGANYTLTLPTSTGNSGEVLTTDGSGLMSWEEVVGNEISTTAPTSPSQGALWTDTSADPAAPILKTWNGSAWVAVGSAAPSEFAPVVNNVVLTENDPTGNRFTSQTFDVEIDMLIEGVPHSQKGLKGEVTASFAQYPNSELVSSNNVVKASNGTNPTRIQTGRGYAKMPVWAPLGPTSWGYVWPYWPDSGNTSTFRLMGSTDLNDWDNGGNMLLDWSTYTNNRSAFVTRYFPPNEHHGFGYLMQWSPSVYGNAYVTNQFRFNPNSGWDDFRTYEWGMGIVQGSDKQYYWVDTNSGVNKITRSHYLNGGGTTRAYNTPWGLHTGDSRGMIGVGNGVAVMFYTHSSQLRIRTAVISENFADGTGCTDHAVGGNARRPSACGFAAGYFWIIQNGDIVYRSSDGANWSNVGTLPVAGTTYGFAVDPDTGNPLFMGYLGSQYYICTTSNGGGSFQTVFMSGDNGAGATYHHAFVGDKFVTTDDNGVLQHFDWNVQTLTLAGTGEDYASFNVGDAIRPVGSTDDLEIGYIRSISGTSIGVTGGHVYSAGEQFEGINATSSGESSRYLVIDATGAVSGTVGSDPGYVNVGPNTSQTLTFPATFASGDSPDTELPAGTTIKVSAQATNSEGSSEYGPSNIVTPS